MAKVDLGLKRSCASCDMRFYDFNRTPILCPGCGTEFDAENLIKARKGRGAKAPAKAAAVSTPDAAVATAAANDAIDESLDGNFDDTLDDSLDDSADESVDETISDISAGVEDEDFEDVDFDDGEVDEEAGGLIQDNISPDDELLSNISTGDED